MTLQGGALGGRDFSAEAMLRHQQDMARYVGGPWGRQKVHQHPDIQLQPVQFADAAMLHHDAPSTNFNPPLYGTGVPGAPIIKSEDFIPAAFLERQMIFRFASPVAAIQSITFPLRKMDQETFWNGDINNVQNQTVIGFALLTVPFTGGGQFDLTTVVWNDAYFKTPFSKESVLSALYATPANFAVPSPGVPFSAFVLLTQKSESAAPTDLDNSVLLLATKAQWNSTLENGLEYTFSAADKTAIGSKVITGVHVFMNQSAAGGMSLLIAPSGSKAQNSADFSLDPKSTVSGTARYLAFGAPIIVSAP